MKYLVLLSTLIVFIGCSNSTKNSPKISPIAMLEKLPSRKPAMHAYGSYTCVSGNLSLVYDGPGSNYAVGGYSHLYLHVSKNEQHRVLAANLMNGETENNSLNDVVGDEVVGVVFNFEKTIFSGKTKINPKVGEKCTPDEYDYDEARWKTVDKIEFKHISADVAKQYGIKEGDKLNFRCRHTSSVPIKCPASGKWTKESLAR